MRKYLRRLARANMRDEGIQHPNKRVSALNPKTGLVERFPSYFSENWRRHAARKIEKEALIAAQRKAADLLAARKAVTANA